MQEIPTSVGCFQEIATNCLNTWAQLAKTYLHENVLIIMGSEMGRLLHHLPLSQPGSGGKFVFQDKQATSSNVSPSNPSFC